jgi:hypothetical protein
VRRPAMVRNTLRISAREPGFLQAQSALQAARS